MKIKEEILFGTGAVFENRGKINLLKQYDIIFKPSHCTCFGHEKRQEDVSCPPIF